MIQQVKYSDWGRIDYKEAWDKQTEVLNELVAIKKGNGENHTSNKHQFILCEHPPVYTLGKSGSLDHLLLNEDELNEKEISFYKINRGGDITFHGLGQIVGYPILDLDLFFHDVHKYVTNIEEMIIRTLQDYNLEGTRIKGFTGVWLPAAQGKPNRKICAIGVHLSRWVTMHGFAFNINTDLGYFGNIIPCGIVDDDKAVTSLSKELGQVIDVSEVKARLLSHFSTIFECEIINENA